jgi:kynurenine formamidase
VLHNDEALNRRAHSRADIDELAQQYNTWGQWGSDDELGAGNRVTTQTVRAAAALIRRGEVFSMALPLDKFGPQATGGSRVNPQHVMLLTPADPSPAQYPTQRFSDDAVYMPLQAATQWDGFCHFFDGGYSYNRRDLESVTPRGGAAFNSITNMKDKAVGRGVLLDIPRFKGRDWLVPGESIQDTDLEECAAAQGVMVGEGDFVLVRTGQLAEVRSEGSWGAYAGGDAPGLGVSAANFLCSRRVTATATDTWGVEVKPYETPDVMAPLHVILLVHAGIYLGEMWDMEALAEDCAQDGVYEFFVAAQPLTVTGSVGSPLNPLAIK